jgi:hypothetical protein
VAGASMVEGNRHRRRQGPPTASATCDRLTRGIDAATPKRRAVSKDSRKVTFTACGLAVVPSCPPFALPPRCPGVLLTIGRILLCVVPLSHLVGLSAQSDQAGKFSGFVLFGA